MKQCTIKDVAKSAGVSYSTVSRALNDSPLIPEKTKTHVQEIAKQMGFVFNENARSLITKKSHCIAVVLPEHFESINVNVYHSRLLSTIREEMERHGFDLLLTYQTNHYDQTNSIQRLVTQNRIDGVLFLAEDPLKITLSVLKESELPAVFVHYPPSSRIDGFDCVYSDNRRGGEIAASYLLSKGYRDFLVIGSEEYHREFELRKEGFLSILEKEHVDATTFNTTTDFFQASEFAMAHLDIFHKGLSVFATNDLMALGIISALEKTGYRIPEDIAVMGYDDSEFCEYSSPPLSTIHQAREDIAFVSCRCLLSRMEEGKRKVIRKGIEPMLVVRSST